MLEKTGLKLAQMDVIELNEAFAAQGLGVTRDHGLPDDAIRKSEWRAIAVGHPLGASGARLITTAIYNFAAPELRPKNVRDGPRRLDWRFLASLFSWFSFGLKQACEERETHRLGRQYPCGSQAMPCHQANRMRVVERHLRI